MNILGIGGVLGEPRRGTDQGRPIAAAIEEAKLTRRAEPGRLPEAAIAACLKIARLRAGRCRLRRAGAPAAAGLRAAHRAAHVPKARVVSIDHHAAHAAAAYFASPFEDATVITLDREGDLRCGAKWRGEGNRLTLEDEILYPDSIGELYGRVTELLGFRRAPTNTACSGFPLTGQPRI